MFNMEHVGRRISKLRKEKNMTQLELADKMGISFQAVSNWERGNSMPDISKLPELAELFGVSIDELLGERAELVESIVKGDVQEYLENNEVTARDLCGIAPILKPDQVDELSENIEVQSLREIEDLLPFLGRDVADRIALKIVEEGRDEDFDIIVPFVSTGMINDIARKMIEKNQTIRDIAPFIGKDIIGEIADDLYETSGLDGVEDILPFLPKSSW